MQAQLLLQRLATGARLWTANRRLARHWRLQYDNWQQASGLRAWAAPSIHALDDWALDQYQASWQEEIVLSPFAEARLLESLLPKTPPVLDRAATAKAMQRTWRTVHEWQVDLADPSFQDLSEPKLFQQVATDLATLCRDKRFLTSCQVLPRVPTGAGETYLAGFDELTPQQTQWLRPLQNLGGYTTWESGERPVQCWQYAAASPRQEMEAAADWATARIAQHARHSPHSDCRLVIVVDDLAGKRETLAEIFRERTGPGLFNFSLGGTLAEHPLVHAALTLLQSMLHPQSAMQWGFLLRSPFFALAKTVQEQGQLAQFAWALPGQVGGEISLQQLVQLLRRERTGLPGSPATETIQALQTAVATWPARQSPGEWANLFDGLLRTAHWTEARQMNAAERQACIRWKKLLVEFAALSLVEPTLTATQAVSLCKTLAAETLFQPEQTTDAPIQIMEALQAAGAEYDGLWVIGSTNQLWPAPPRPDPFLPWILQRDRKLPQSSAERELLYARRMMKRLIHSAPETIWSWPRIEEAAERQPSSLIDELPQYNLLPSNSPRWVDLQFAARQEEQIADSEGPAVEEGEAVSGGTQLLKAQSLCPFQAFAKFRLQCAEPQESQLGVDPLEKGNILHRALELFWARVQTQQELRQLCDQGEDHLLDYVRRAVQTAVKDKLASQEGREEMVRLEGVRAERLLRQWLDEELKRPEFAIEQLEQKQQVEAGPFKLNVIADRIDREPQGRLLLDYKSGNISAASWQGERPKEPQLPFYAIRMPQPPAGIAFAQIKAGDVRLVPWKEKQKSGNVTWAEQLQLWRSAIDALIQEAAEGHAAATPQPGACDHCHLPLLCRIAEASSTDLGEELEPANE